MKKRQLDKRYYNLNHSTQSQGSWVFRHPKTILVIFVVIIIAAIYSIYGLPLWQIKKIKLTGNYTLSTDELKTITLRQMQGRWLLFFKQDKLWSFDTHAFQARLKEKWIFSKLEIKKIMPDTLVLNVVEKKPNFIIRVNDKILGINDQGVISNFLENADIGQAVELKLAIWPENLYLGENLFSTNDLNFFLTFIQTLKKQNDKNLNISHIVVANPPNLTASIVLVGDREIKVDRSSPVNRQTEAFLLAYQEKLKNKKFQYVDVTVPSRVYYK